LEEKVMERLGRKSTGSLQRTLGAVLGAAAVIAMLLAVPSSAGAQTSASAASVLTSAQRYHVSTTNGWATFRNSYGSYVIGAAANGWYFDVSGSSSGYDYGYLYGEGGVSGNPWTKCGWISDTNINADSYFPAAQCGSGTSFVETTFASYVNCYGCNGGYLVTTNSCSDPNEYANVLPWQSTTQPWNAVRQFNPGSTQVYWRYRTKDDQFVMVQDKNTSLNDGWLFIRRSCLSGVTGLPARSNVF
jgi:hypothetical protein